MCGKNPEIKRTKNNKIQLLSKCAVCNNKNQYSPKSKRQIDC